MSTLWGGGRGGLPGFGVNLSEDLGSVPASAFSQLISGPLDKAFSSFISFF